MPQKFLRRATILPENPEVGLVERFRIWFEGYLPNVEWPFQCCGKAELDSDGYKTLLVVFEILAEGSESGLRGARINFRLRKVFLFEPNLC